MAKPATAWTSNPAKNAGVLTYNDANTTYSEITAYYVSSTSNLDELNKPSTSWSSNAKTTTGWAFNPNYTVTGTYDEATVTYDTFANLTYDGIVAGQSPISSKPQTAWTAV